MSSDEIPEGLFNRITWARGILELSDVATQEEIDAKKKALLRRWHPDHAQDDDPNLAHQKTRHIIDAYQIISDYIQSYQYRFDRDEVEKYLSMEEWWFKRFGGDPVWDKKQEKL